MWIMGWSVETMISGLLAPPDSPWIVSNSVLSVCLCYVGVELTSSIPGDHEPRPLRLDLHSTPLVHSVLPRFGLLESCPPSSFLGRCVVRLST